MSKRNDDSNAFPVAYEVWADGFGGMSLRDYFVAKFGAAMIQGAMANDPRLCALPSPSDVARRAGEYADAMIAEGEM